MKTIGKNFMNKISLSFILMLIFFIAGCGDCDCDKKESMNVLDANVTQQYDISAYLFDQDLYIYDQFRTMRMISYNDFNISGAILSSEDSRFLTFAKDGNSVNRYNGKEVFDKNISNKTEVFDDYIQITDYEKGSVSRIKNHNRRLHVGEKFSYINNEDLNITLKCILVGHLDWMNTRTISENSKILEFEYPDVIKIDCDIDDSRSEKIGFGNIYLSKDYGHVLTIMSVKEDDSSVVSYEYLDKYSITN